VKRDEIDEAIDAVVRQIMRTEPPAGLRARVMGQLSAPERARLFTMPRLAVAAVFAVCVVAGLIMQDRARSGGEPRRAADVAAAAPAPPAIVAPPNPGLPPALPAPRSTPAPVVARSRVPPLEDRVVSATSVEETALTVSVAPLRPMPTIDAAPLTDSPVRITAIAIRPLELMDPVRVDPLPSTPR